MFGLNRDSNPGPLAPKARIIPLDHWAATVIFKFNAFVFFVLCTLGMIMHSFGIGFRTFSNRIENWSNWYWVLKLWNRFEITSDHHCGGRDFSCQVTLSGWKCAEKSLLHSDDQQLFRALANEVALYRNTHYHTAVTSTKPY